VLFVTCVAFVSDAVVTMKNASDELTAASNESIAARTTDHCISNRFNQSLAARSQSRQPAKPATRQSVNNYSETTNTDGRTGIPWDPREFHWHGSTLDDGNKMLRDPHGDGKKLVVVL